MVIQLVHNVYILYIVLIKSSYITKNLYMKTFTSKLSHHQATQCLFRITSRFKVTFDHQTRRRLKLYLANKDANTTKPVKLMDAVNCKGIMIFPEVCKNDTIGRSFQRFYQPSTHTRRKVLMNHKFSDETLGYPNEGLINDKTQPTDYNTNDISN